MLGDAGVPGEPLFSVMVVGTRLAPFRVASVRVNSARPGWSCQRGDNVAEAEASRRISSSRSSQLPQLPPHPRTTIARSPLGLPFLIISYYKVLMRRAGKHVYAVVTGDLVDSSKAPATDRDRVLKEMRSVFRSVETDITGLGDFQIFRGDSFQTVLEEPAHALKTALLLRCSCLLQVGLDMRLAVGVGSVEYRSRKSVGEGIGPAFTLSGHSLDEMRDPRRLVIATQDDAVNSEMNALTALLDAVVDGWSTNAIVTVTKRLHGKKQQAIADELKISQSAVNQRLAVAHWWAIEAAAERWHTVADQLTRKT